MSALVISLAAQWMMSRYKSTNTRHIASSCSNRNRAALTAPLLRCRLPRAWTAGHRLGTRRSTSTAGTADDITGWSVPPTLFRWLPFCMYAGVQAGAQIRHHLLGVLLFAFICYGVWVIYWILAHDGSLVEFSCCCLLSRSAAQRKRLGELPGASDALRTDESGDIEVMIASHIQLCSSCVHCDHSNGCSWARS